MDKGTRVEVIDGDSQGVTGTVFWTGPDRYSENDTRLGIKGDDGQTYWMSSRDVEKSDRKMEVPEAPPVQRGDRVRWAEGEGTIFWAGPSKFGDGVRVGIEDDNGDKHWLDARQLTIVEQGDGSGAGAGKNNASRGGSSRSSSGSFREDVPPPSDEVVASSTPPWERDEGDPGGDDSSRFGARDAVVQEQSDFDALNLEPPDDDDIPF